jgi:hypothetical protein
MFIGGALQNCAINVIHDMLFASTSISCHSATAPLQHPSGRRLPKGVSIQDLCLVLAAERQVK